MMLLSLKQEVIATLAMALQNYHKSIDHMMNNMIKECRRLPNTCVFAEIIVMKSKRLL